MQDPSKIPSWMKIIKNYYPDFIIRDPEVRCHYSAHLDFPAGLFTQSTVVYLDTARSLNEIRSWKRLLRVSTGISLNELPPKRAEIMTGSEMGGVFNACSDPLWLLYMIMCFLCYRGHLCGRSQARSFPNRKCTPLMASPSASPAWRESAMTRTGRAPPTCTSLK